MTGRHDRPAPVRITDLADPGFPSDVEPIIEAMRAMGPDVSLEPPALTEAARAETGLSDFGDSAFSGRLELLCRAFDGEAGLSGSGRVTTAALLTGLLKNRLLIQDVVDRHPKIDDVPIERPIIICGLPRTGTTHLHNLLAADTALRSLPYWESLEPVLAPSDAAAVARGEPDPRLARTDAALGFINSTMPFFVRMHEMTTEHVHEEIQLLAIDFSTMLFETTAPIPSWRDHYLAEDQTPVYGYLKRVLKVLQWLRPDAGSRWVLKSPQHLEQFGPLLSTFPDATFVVTHRDPVAILASLCTMLAYTARLALARVDPVAIGAYWRDRLVRMLGSCHRDRDVLPADQSIDVRFHELMADDVAMVERIYALADQPFTRAVRDAMDAFTAAHPRGRHGAVLYDLADFGLDGDQCQQALQPYIDRFGVEVEPRPG